LAGKKSISELLDYILPRYVMYRGYFSTVEKCFCKRTKNVFAAKSVRKYAKNVDIKREIQILVECANHPNLITIYAAFETRHRTILILDLYVPLLITYTIGYHAPTYRLFFIFRAAGVELFDIISGGPIRESETIGIMRQVILAVDFLHSKSIVHLDLKVFGISFSKRT